MIYHYTSNGFFFNGYIDVDNFLLRKSSVFNFTSIFGIKEVFNFNKSFSLSTITSYDEDSILRDTFFESQDFKHSTLFEFV